MLLRPQLHVSSVPYAIHCAETCTHFPLNSTFTSTSSRYGCYRRLGNRRINSATFIPDLLLRSLPPQTVLLPPIRVPALDSTSTLSSGSESPAPSHSGTRASPTKPSIDTTAPPSAELQAPISSSSFIYPTTLPSVRF